MSIVDWKAKFVALFVAQMKKIESRLRQTANVRFVLRFLETNIDRNSIN